MKQNQTDRTLLRISFGAYFVMSASFPLMPVESLKILPGILFWGGLLAGAALQILLASRRKAFFKANKIKRHRIERPRNGLLTFCANREAKIVDILLGVSFLATVLSFILTKGYGYICYPLIGITLFAFCLHCILNGRIYFHINNPINPQKATDGRSGKFKDKGEGEK